MGAYRRLVARLGHQRWFAVMLRQLGGARLDGWLYRRSDGRLAITGLPVIYIRDGAKLVISSEHFGQQRPAAWPLDLRADPVATVRLGDASAAYRARLAAAGEIERYWPALLEAWPAHETYRARSGARHVFVLEPCGSVGEQS
jgi:deazaflavin-dependent oxidoreductase (nitroreductase family)